MLKHSNRNLTCGWISDGRRRSPLLANPLRKFTEEIQACGRVRLSAEPPSG
jgi:hypothetical protein